MATCERCRLLANCAGRDTQGTIDRAALEECSQEQDEADQSGPMPALNGQAVFERNCDKRQSQNCSHVLINCAHIYRYGVSPLDNNLQEVGTVFDLPQDRTAR